MDYKALYEQQLQENKKLKEENKKLKEDGELEKRDMCDFCDNERCHLVKRDAGYDEWTCETCYKEQYPTEEEELEKLKGELEDAAAREDSMFQTLNKMRKEESDWALKKIEELKEENKKVKEEARRRTVLSVAGAQKIQRKMDDLEQVHFKLEEVCDKVKEENKELTEENETLKGLQGEFIKLIKILKEKVEKLQEQFDKVQEQNEKLMYLYDTNTSVLLALIEQLGEYISRVDQPAVNVYNDLLKEAQASGNDPDLLALEPVTLE